ncbi:G-type lectin S-receptor serine/threonine-protein kinase SD2-5 [Trifolium repens]|nr:G-type lectin S-receptor serine/threonine-protein kinase SD2-5 [Trifolium repens]
MINVTGKNNKVHYASLVSNSWNFYDKVGALVWKIVFSDHPDPKSFYAAILDPNGAISFYDLNKGKSTNPEVFKLPQDPCGIPEPCDPYYVFFFENWSSSTELLYVGEDLDYFALKYDAPVLKSTLNSCKDACVRNCSCLVLFHENSTGRCFHFDQTGSFQRFKGNNGGFVSYMKVSTDGGGIVRDNSGRKDMLKGFCAEGPHRLLVYEYMARGSLDKWIFKNSENTLLLTWETRYNIAIGNAKGLAYLHEECEVRIIHCDIKPQNVLLDDNFMAKVSDFGLVKLMSREQSHVFTTLRGTRGYLASEWITNYAISEKSDVFSYGMLLLEIIGGRKNYDQWEGPEKAHFPSYVSRMMEEGKIREVIDQKIDIDENDESVVTALKVALWCIQDDMNLRPSMSNVVQMLEGLCQVNDPPLLQSSTYSAYLKMSSGEASSSGQASFYSNVPLSCVQLSGPR